MYIKVYSVFKQVWTITRKIKGGTMKTSYQDYATNQDSVLSKGNKTSTRTWFSTWNVIIMVLNNFYNRN